MKAVARSPSPTTRVLEALEDHTMLEIIAASACLSQLQALRVLHDLEERGLVERRGEDCWRKR